MQNLDTTKLEALMEQGKWEEAKGLLVEYCKTHPLSEVEQGGAYVNFISAYMKVVNSINQRYEQFLDEALVILKASQKDEHTLTDRMDMEDARKTIKGA